MTVKSHIDDKVAFVQPSSEMDLWHDNCMCPTSACAIYKTGDWLCASCECPTCLGIRVRKMGHSTHHVVGVASLTNALLMRRRVLRTMPALMAAINPSTSPSTTVKTDAGGQLASALFRFKFLMDKDVEMSKSVARIAFEMENPNKKTPQQN